MAEEKKGLNIPMAVGFSVTAFGLVMALISPDSFWSIVAIVISVIAGGIMLHVADGKDYNLIFAGWVCIGMGVTFLIFVTQKDNGEKRDLATARAIALVAQQKLRQCGQTITPEEIAKTRQLLEGGRRLEDVFLPMDSTEAKNR